MAQRRAAHEPGEAGLTLPAGSLLDCADHRGRPRGRATETRGLGNFSDRDRRHVAIVVTSDGRRVPMPVDSGLVDLPLVRSLLLGLESLLGLITGSRRENGGPR
jgi:hypothetical protein